MSPLKNCKPTKFEVKARHAFLAARSETKLFVPTTETRKAQPCPANWLNVRCSLYRHYLPCAYSPYQRTTNYNSTRALYQHGT